MAHPGAVISRLAKVAVRFRPRIDGFELREFEAIHVPLRSTLGCFAAAVNLVHADVDGVRADVSLKAERQVMADDHRE